MSKGFAEALEGELKGWVSDGLVSREQAGLILARYPEADTTHNRTVSTLSWIGGTLVVVGTIVLVATNWKDIPSLVRILLLAAVTAGLWAIGTRMILRQWYPFLAHALLLMGGGAFGGLVFEVANAFHLPPDNGMLVAVWILGMLPVAYGLKDLGLQVMCLLLAPVWVVLTFISTGGLGDLRTAAGTFTAVGLLLWGIGLFHPARGEPGRLPHFHEAYLVAGTFLVHIPAFVVTFFGHERAILFEGATMMPAAVAVWLVAAAALAAGLVARQGKEPWLAALLGLGAIHMLAILLVPLGAWDDILYGALVIAWVVLAVPARQELLFNIGLLLFVAMVIGRYMEFVADMGQPGLVFVLGGLILLGLGVGLEKLRRVMTPRIREG